MNKIDLKHCFRKELHKDNILDGFSLRFYESQVDSFKLFEALDSKTPFTSWAPYIYPTNSFQQDVDQ